MGLHHRKLIPLLCTSFSNQTQSYCSTSTNNDNPSPTPPIFPHQDRHSLAVSTSLVITITLLVSSFLVLFCFAIYASFFSRRRSQQHQPEETRDVFFDEERGPIRTSGLQQSFISEIAVCKYKKGEGLVEGTECSVCLNEFEEDENLRILPKCNHAFHLSCIDTWLTEHSNCPLCRAPMVTKLDNSSSMEDTQMEILEDGGGNNGELEMRNEAEEEEEVKEGRRVCENSEVENVQGRRRIPVSLDSSSASKIYPGLVTEVSGERKFL